MPSFLRSTASWVAGHALPVVAGAVIVAAAAGGGVSYALASHTTAAGAGSKPAAAAAPGVQSTAKTINPRRAAIEKLVTIVTTDTGQSLAAIEAQLQAGKTMNQVAGSNAAKLENDVLAAVTTALDKAVSSGRMTAAQESTVLSKARSYLDKVMAEPGPTLLQELQSVGKAHAGAHHPAASPSPAATPAI